MGKSMAPGGVGGNGSGATLAALQKTAFMDRASAMGLTSNGDDDEDEGEDDDGNGSNASSNNASSQPVSRGRTSKNRKSGELTRRVENMELKVGDIAVKVRQILSLRAFICH